MKKEVSSVLLTVLFVALLVITIGLGVYYWVFVDEDDKPNEIMDPPIVEPKKEENKEYDVVKTVSLNGKNNKLGFNYNHKLGSEEDTDVYDYYVTVSLNDEVIVDNYKIYTGYETNNTVYNNIVNNNIVENGWDPIYELYTLNDKEIDKQYLVLKLSTGNEVAPYYDELFILDGSKILSDLKFDTHSMINVNGIYDMKKIYKVNNDNIYYFEYNCKNGKQTGEPMHSANLQIINGVVKQNLVKEYNESEYEVEGGGSSSSFCWYK